jgi:hypothetical protein
MTVVWQVSTVLTSSNFPSKKESQSAMRCTSHSSVLSGNQLRRSALYNVICCRDDGLALEHGHGRAVRKAGRNGDGRI